MEGEESHLSQVGKSIFTNLSFNSFFYHICIIRKPLRKVPVQMFSIENLFPPFQMQI